jgi:hypothetical protein
VSVILGTGQALPDSVWIAVSVIVGIAAFALLSWAFIRLDRAFRRRA